MSDSGFWPELRGRQDECNTLSRLVASAQEGRSQVLVLRGETGIGKTALLEFLADSARGCQVGRAAGVESELELAYAGLHQLCSPYLDRIGTLPAPQRSALGTAFGLQPGRAPDRFLLGLAVLTLLSEAAEEQPLICMVDDAQWLDQASVQTLEFVARRLAAEPVGLVFAVRETDEEPKLAGLPELRLRGLGIDDAAALLESAVPGTLDPRVRNRILAESDGNPLALLELPRALTAAELAFGTASRPRSTAPGQPPGARLRPPAERPSPAVPAIAAGRGRGTRRGRSAALARCAAAGYRGRRGGRSRGRGPDRAARPGPVPASPGSFGRLPLGDPAAAAGGPPGAGRRHGPGTRSRPPRLAPRLRGRGPG